MEYLLAALLGGFLVFNSAATPERAARSAEEALLRRFPGSQVRVVVRGKRGRNVMRGRFREVRVELSRFAWQGFPLGRGSGSGTAGRMDKLQLILRDFSWNNLALRAADFEFKDVEYEWQALRHDGRLNLLRSGPGTAQLKIEASALQNVLADRVKDIRILEVRFEGNRLVLAGEKPLLGVNAPFTLYATPRGRGGQVWLHEPQLNMGPLPIPGLITANLLSGLNPIYTFDPAGQWPYEVRLKDVRPEGNSLLLTADLVFRP